MTLSSVQLRALNTVIEEGSYSAAARRLGMTQPAISQAIRKLQESFDVKLFEQRGRHLVPTDLGLELSLVTAQMQKLEKEALLLLQRGKALEKGTLRVGLGNSMPGMALIGEFKRSFPKIQVDVQLGNYSNIIDNVMERNVDVGILPNVPDDGRFFRHVCLKQQVVAIAPPSHPLIHQDEVSLVELSRYPLIFRSQGSSTQRVVDQGLRIANLGVVPELILETRDGVCEAVANGLGVGFMWSHGTSRENGIIKIPVNELRKSYEEVVFRRGDAKSKIINAFFNSIMNTSLFER